MVEADFQRYYALDLRHEVMHTGARRLGALVGGLPPDSALRRGGSLWTLENELTAVGIELNQMWLSMVLSAWMAKGAKVPPIVPITHADRPSAVADEPEPVRVKATSDPAVLAAAFYG